MKKKDTRTNEQILADLRARAAGTIEEDTTDCEEECGGYRLLNNSEQASLRQDAMLFGLRWQGHSMIGKKVPVDYDGRDA